MRRARVLALLSAVLLAGALFAAARVTAAPACTITFDGGATGTGTAWGTAANWDTNVLPGAADDVCIPASFTVVHSTGADSVLSIQSQGDLQLTGGTLDLTRTSDDSAISTLTMTSGTLSGAARVVIGTSMTWSAGTMTGAGTTAIAGAATLTESGNVSLTNGRTLEVAGVFDKTGDVVVFTGGPANPVIHVLASGVLRKSGGAGTGRIDTPLTNDGAVRSTSGTLQLGGGSAGGTGSFGSAGATGTVAITGGAWTLGDGAAWLGGVTFSSGTVSVPGAATLTVSGANTMSGGTLNGTGTVALASGTFTWSAGTMTGAGLTEVAAATTVAQSGNVTVGDGRTLEVAGIFDKTADVVVFTAGPANPVIHVLASGVLRKSGGAATGRIDTPLTNDGAVRSTSGTLQLDGPASGGTGSFGSAGATGTVTISGGAWTLGDGATWLGGVTQSGGTITVPGGATLTESGANSMTGGTLNGTGAVAIASGTFTWTAGTMTAGGLTQVAAPATVAQTGNVTVGDGRTIEVAGIFDKTGDVSVFTAGPASPLVHVLASGVLRKSGGTLAGRIDTPLTNDGAVRSTSGTLQLDGGSSGGTGSFGAPAAPGTVAFTGATWTLGDGATWLGGVTFSGGTVTVPGGATLTVSGANTMSGGTLNGTGTMTLASGTFTWSAGTMTGAGRTQVAAPATVAQSGNVTVGDGRTVDVAGIFDKIGDFHVFTAGPASPLVHVLASGVLRKSGGAGTGRIDPPLRNDGTVDGTSGVLQLQAGTAQAGTGTFHGADRTDLVLFNGGTHTLGAGSQLTGFVRVNGGTVGIAQGVTVHVPDHLLLTSGTFAGPGTLQVDGTLELAGGTLKGPGSATVVPAATVAVTGACGSTLSAGYALTNQGTMAVDGGSQLLLIDPGTAISNSGHINLGTGAASCANHPTINAFPAGLQNTGTIEKVGGVGVGEVDGLDNDGTVLSSSGDLQLYGATGATQAGSFASSGAGNEVSFIGGLFALEPTASLGGHIRLTGGEVDVPGGMNLTVPTLTTEGGTIAGDGTLTVTGTLDWSGGAMSGSGATVIAPGGVANVSMPPFANVSLDTGRQLINRGTTNLGGELDVGEGSSVLNTGTFVLASGANVFGGSGGFFFGALFHNTGTLQQSGASTTPFAVPLDNDGTLTATAGELDLLTLLNLSDNGDLVGGAFEAHGATLQIPAPVASLGARVVLDGASAKLATGTDDALADLRRVTANGALVVTGGRSQPVSGALSDAGVVDVRSGSTLAVTGAYAQRGTATTALALDGHLTAASYAADPGSTLRATLATAAGPPLSLSGTATPAGALDLVTPGGFAPSAGTDLPLLGASSVTGTFSPVTGDTPGGPVKYQVGYGATAVTVHVVAASRGTAPPVAPPAAGRGTALPLAPPAVLEPAPAPLVALAIESGPWTRVGAALVTTRRGATVVARHVTARRVTLLVRTGPHAGAIAITWRGHRVRRVDLGAAHRGTRRIHLTLRGPGTLRIRVIRAGRVSVRSLAAG